MQRLVIDRITGSAIPHLFQKDIKGLALSIPPMEEQIQIVEEIESRLGLAESLKISINDILRQVEMLKMVILGKAYSGDLTNQDYTLESSTDLLKDIKLEQESFIEQQKIVSKATPKQKNVMQEKLSILQILESSNTPMSAKDVWLQSMYKDDIEAFYSELRKMQDSVVEIKKETESLLSLRHANR